MQSLRFRQVHLDFHTSEHIPKVGKKFSKENFQKVLKLGNLDSITCFAKCHHSWCYYPSEVGHIHPTLDFDLLGEQIKAAHEIGVKAPIYITVGWSTNDAINHPEWIAKDKDGNNQTTNYDLNANLNDKKPDVSWVLLCPNNDYQEHIYKLTKEICDRYDVVDGLFYDIVFVSKDCYCDKCLENMRKKGLNPENHDDVLTHYREGRIEFMKKCTEILHEKHTNGTIFFNGGADMYETQWHECQTHYEMEDLPTTWGGYDIMPPRAKFFSRTGKDYLGMTGKFHTMWGEFGGFKNPNALKLECSVMMMYGASCSVGDQCHPCGEMDLETYRTIGVAYDYVEQIEDYCKNVKETTNLAIVLHKTVSTDESYATLTSSDEGLVKMLLENQYDFDIILENDNYDKISKYDTIILPDDILLSKEFADKLSAFVKNGGGLVLTGESGLDENLEKFLVDVGLLYLGKSEYDIDYTKVKPIIEDGIVNSPVLFYSPAYIVSAPSWEVLSEVYTPYFNRTYAKYCSHKNTPNKLEPEAYPGAVLKGRVLYIAHKIFKMYKEFGAQHHRDYFINALKLIYNNSAVKVKLLSGGRVRFVEQEAKSRYVLHLLYAQPIQRGVAAVLEDIPEIFNTPVSVKVDKKIKFVKLVPGNIDIKFKQVDNEVSFVVPIIKGHQMLSLEY
jgi:hypothetical protein